MYSTDTFSFFSTISRGMMSSIVFFGDGSPRYESGPARGVGSQNWKKPPYGVGSGSRSNENGVWWMPTKTPSLTTYCELRTRSDRSDRSVLAPLPPRLNE